MKSIENLVNNEFKSYSEYVLYNRAIPSMMDGFKAGQRKIIYTTNRVARNKLNKTLLLIPKKDYKEEIEEAISKSKIKIKKVFYYDVDPKKLTKQI